MQAVVADDEKSKLIFNGKTNNEGDKLEASGKMLEKETNSVNKRSARLQPRSQSKRNNRLQTLLTDYI